MQRKIKISVWMLLVTLFCLVLPQTGQAAAQPSLYLNGSSLMLPESIKMINNSVMIPIRVVSEELGFKVDWDQKTRTVTINDVSTIIKLTINQETAIVNDKEVKLTVVPVISNSSTLVPLRFVGESMGMKVDWDNQSKTVYISSPDDGSDTPPTTGSDVDTGFDGGGTGTTPGNGDSEGSNETVPPQTNDAKVVDFAFFENTLHISADQTLQPKIMTMTNPDKVVIDLEGAVFSEEFLNKFVLDSSGQGKLEIQDYPDVEKIRFALFSTSPNTVRFVVDANYALSYEILSNEDGLLSVTFSENSNPSTSNPSTSESEKPKDTYTIVVDAGHGNHDSGAVSVKGRYEKTVNLEIALKVAEIAEKESKLNVVLTRSTDVFLELSERVKIANDLNADLFVSIHANSIDGKQSVGGTETYYYREESKAFAEVMHKYLMKGTQLKDRGVKVASHHVTRNTKMPATLLEIGFLSNPEEEAQLFNEDFQWRVAEQIVNGMKAYLGI